jgi:hypothetical protein
LIKGIILQEEIKIVLNVDASNLIKQTLLGIKAQIDPSTIIVDYFSTPLLLTGRSFR